MTDPNAPQPGQQPAYPPAQPAYQQPAPAYGPGDYPGKTLGIVGLVFAFIFPIVGLILSIIGGNQSKAVGAKNTPAKVGLILSIIFIALWIIFWIIYFVVIAALVNAGGGMITELCNQPGVTCN